MDDKQAQDRARYDRQERAIGKDAMQYLFSTKALVCGLGGLGVETAKNLILMGVKEVALYDSKTVTHLDLGTQFFLQAEENGSIGKERAQESLEKLQQLNDLCKVHIVTGELDEQLLKRFTIVIFTDHSIASLVDVNDLCRANKIAFIAAETRGVFGSLFVDLGDSWTSREPSTRPLAAGAVVDISVIQSGEAIVSTHDRRETTVTPHQLFEGAYVSFYGVEGMSQLNDEIPRKVTRIVDGSTFSIGNVSGYSPYTTGGYFQEVRMKKEFQFRPLRECLDDPRIESPYDYSKFEYPGILHVGFQALAAFVKQFARYPAPYDESDADKLWDIAKQLNNQSKQPVELNETVVRLMSYTAQGQINPMTAFFGAIAAQEVLKAATHKFAPIQQWFYLESILSLPNPLPTVDDVQANGSRYDGQIIVFGQKFHKKLTNSKLFVVGAGALGCEFLKNFAMMGVSTGANGKLVVTDMDGIEVSNLSRQFLFHEKHVKQMKSIVAKQAIEEMNPNVQVEARIDKVASDTEHVYNEKFWDNIDAVVAALDNVEARIYVDEQCVQYKKPFFESGTLGSAGHITTVIPFKTQNYGHHPGVKEQGFPECTIHEFPNLIQHTIIWAKSHLDYLYGSSAKRVNKFLSNPAQFLEQTGNNIGVLSQLYNYVIRDIPSNYGDCVRWARVKFEELFNFNVRNVLYTHPLNKTTNTGTSFWSGSKRTPTPLQFDSNDLTHINFIEYAARLLAFMYSIPIDDCINYQEVIKETKLPDYAPQKTSAEEEDRNEEPEQKRRRLEEEDRLYTEQLKKLAIVKEKLLMVTGISPLVPIEFEKDDDSNYHVDFVTAASNLRARSYKIPEADKHKTKGIAGNIIPAMITTTAAATALVCLEFYKSLCEDRTSDDYRNGYIDVGMGNYLLTFVNAPEKTILDQYTVWDSLEIAPLEDITFGELIERISKLTNRKVAAITHGGALLYDSSVDMVSGVKVVQYIEQHILKAKMPATKSFVMLNVSFDVPNASTTVQGPPVKYIFRESKKVDKKSQIAAKLAKIKQQQEQNRNE